MSSFDANNSSNQSNFIVDIVVNILKIDNIELLSLIIRKLAHFTEYFILYILLYNVIKHYVHTKKIIFYSIMGVIIYAVSDELHQYFVPERSSTIKDVFIDTCGGIAASIVNNLFYKVKNMIKI